MMNIKLVKLTSKYKKQVIDMFKEWKEDIEKNMEIILHGHFFKSDFQDIDYYIENLDYNNNVNGHVSSSTFLL